LLRRDRLVDVSLEDSYYTYCVGPHAVGRADLERTVRSGRWLFDLHHILCPNEKCALFVGVRVVRMRPAPETQQGDGATQQGEDDGRSVAVANPHAAVVAEGKERARRRKERERTAIVEQFLPRWEQQRRRRSRSRSMSIDQGDPTAGPPSNAVTGAPFIPWDDESSDVRIGQTFVGVRYVRIKDARTGKPQVPRIPVRCSGCRSVLSFADQIMCTERRWSFADSPEGSPPEPACYMNSLLSEAITVGAPYLEQLAQGPFDMADVHCGNPDCGQQVGYAFVRDRSRGQRNKHQNLRMGLVNSRTHIDLPQEIAPPPPERPQGRSGSRRSRRRR
jgi:hypothetical protein